MPENNPGTTELLTPSQRLEQSRRALLETMLELDAATKRNGFLESTL